MKKTIIVICCAVLMTNGCSSASKNIISQSPYQANKRIPIYNPGGSQFSKNKDFYNAYKDYKGKQMETLIIENEKQKLSARLVAERARPKAYLERAKPKMVYTEKAKPKNKYTERAQSKKTYTEMAKYANNISTDTSMNGINIKVYAQP